MPQVLAETPGGNPNRVEVVGAHLDSVAAGPGVNDDGSGTSAQLEIAKQIDTQGPGAAPEDPLRLVGR